AVTLADADLKGRDLTSLRHVLSAAAPLGTALTEALQRARLPGQRGIRNDRDKRHYAPGAARGRASQIWIDRAPRSRVSRVVWSIHRPAQRGPRGRAASCGGGARGRGPQIWVDRAPRSRVSSVVWSIPRPAQRWPRESAASSGCAARR